MKAVIQRVKKTSVSINSELFSKIETGILILLGVEKNDDETSVDWLVDKIISLRIFEDENNKMNRSILDVNGEIMVVSQFTLLGDCKKGTRPSFDKAEKPEIAEPLYEKFIQKLKNKNIKTENGAFGAMMDIEILNNGPVTFILEHKIK